MTRSVRRVSRFDIQISEFIAADVMAGPDPANHLASIREPKTLSRPQTRVG